MSELGTCAKSALNVKIVVIKNDSLGQIKWEQMAFLGIRSSGASSFPSISLASLAPAASRVMR
jgi:pyruvate dehydrogenase (quinone)/pyruvate oxidase